MTPPAASSAQRPAALPRAPRRVSGPARPRRPVVAPAPTLVPRLAAAARALPDHRLLDRLVRGRAWIVLIGVALIGIVAMQVSLLKLNAGIGHDVQRASVLQRENDLLRADNSRLAEGQRLDRTAARAGLIAPNPGSVRFVAGRKANAARAVAELAHPGAAIPVTTAAPITPPVAARIPGTGTAPPAAASAPTTTTAPAPVAPAVTPATAPTTVTAPAAPASGTSPTPAGQG